MNDIKGLRLGCWYQCNTWSTEQDYIKLTYFDLEQLYFEDYVFKGIWKDCNAHSGWVYRIEDLREVPLEEIQEWLPLNHLDRFENQQVIEQDYSYLIPIITKLNKQ